MKKTIYLIASLAIVHFISCKKDNNNTPISNTNTGLGMGNGDIYTIAGNGTGGVPGDGGAATTAELDAPSGVAIYRSDYIYIADNYNNCIRKVNTNGIISTFAGNGFGSGSSGSGGYSGDGGPATAAELSNPNGVAVDISGNVYIADLYNDRIRKVNTNGIISTFAGGGNSGLGDGGPATAAEIFYAINVALDNYGNVYIVDGHNCIRKVSTAGIITTIAGNEIYGYSGDGGPATAAELNEPSSVAIDNLRNVYIADDGNQRIRKVSTNGIISTIAGNGYGAPNSGSYSGDGGQATAAELNSPGGLVVDVNYNIYFADEYNHRIRVITIDGIISTLAGNGTAGFEGNGVLATNAELAFPSGLALDNYNNIYIADWGTQTVRKVYK